MQCKVCGSKDFQALEDLKSRNEDCGWDYVDIYYCKQCGTMRVVSWLTYDNK